MIGFARYGVLAMAACAMAAAPMGDAARAETAAHAPAELAAKLRHLFPSGQRAGREGVMQIGVQFRTVTVKDWRECRSTCYAAPAQNGGGCAVWTFIDARNPRRPNICRMWASVPDLKPNPAAVSGRGRLR
jgi:hypothetical protein